jgi:hypothetical protein
VPWLLLAATALFALGPWLTRRLRAGPSSATRAGLGVLLVSI